MLVSAPFLRAWSFLQMKREVISTPVDANPPQINHLNRRPIIYLNLQLTHGFAVVHMTGHLVIE